MVRTTATARLNGMVWAAGLVVAAMAIPGCHPKESGFLAPPVKGGPVLAITPRFTLEPDVSGLPNEPPPFPTPRPGKYRQLTSSECRMFAVFHAPFADDLDSHPDNQEPTHPWAEKCSPRKMEAARVSRLVRGHAADELRNQAAFDALDQYFKLARSEAQLDLLVLAHTELKTQFESVNKAEQQGFKGTVTADELRVQILQVEAEAAKLEAAIGQLNAALRARIGLEPNDLLPLWPEDPLRVNPDEVDVNQAIATGLQYRPDLNVLRVLVMDNSLGAQDVRQQVLASISPLLAAASRISLLDGVGQILTGEKQKDAASSRQSLAAALQSREKQAESEIRAAVLDLHGQKIAAIATAAEVRWQTIRVAELEKRQKSGQQVTGELAKARLDLLKSRGDLLKVVTEWNIAEAKLRKTMGLLVRN